MVFYAIKNAIVISWFFLMFTIPAAADVVLDKKTMKLALTSAELSALAYEIDPPSDGYDMLKYFNDGMYARINRGCLAHILT